MTDYLPPSEFLQSLIEADVTPSDDAVAELIALSADADDANRDWALLLLAQSELDTPEVLAALVRGMDDSHHDAALEALIGVAMRDPEQALPRVAALLDGDEIDSMAVEAATLVADPSLLPALEALRAEFADDGDADFEALLDEAIAACTEGAPPE